MSNLDRMKIRFLVLLTLGLTVSLPARAEVAYVGQAHSHLGRSKCLNVENPNILRIPVGSQDVRIEAHLFPPFLRDLTVLGGVAYSNAFWGLAEINSISFELSE